MEKNDLQLIKFAKTVLLILEAQKEWDSDTTDDIGTVAIDMGLAEADENSEFKIK